MLTQLGFVCVFSGLLFDVLGCLGLVRLPDVYSRLQAATKCVTLGTSSILFGTFLVLGATTAGVKALVCMVFLLLTSPVATHAIARSAHRAGVKPWKGTVVDLYAKDREGEA
jgi:multicomponent Na+:H+ antiporter subunit G